ncbi:hypothetical protein V8E53_015752 [Lactarius tabidus]
MKLASFLTLASLAVSTAFAQGIQIAYPLPNTTITPGCNITVTVVKPDFIDTEISVGLAIGMLQCTAPCPDPTEELGDVLYAGPFNPVFPPPTTPNHEPQQNFTVTVPSFLQCDQTVQLAALVYTLIGAGPSSTIEQASEMLIVQ